MFRRSLLAVLLLAIASPATAQEEATWSSNRPDAQAPLGVRDGRTLDEGRFELTYRYNRLNSTGVWFDTGALSPDFVAGLYETVPLSLKAETHSVGIAFAASPRFTVSANMGFSLRSREQLTSDGTSLFITEANKVSDLELAGIVNFFEEGPYRAQLHLGARLPTGPADVVAETPFSSPAEEALPYDMRSGAGTFGAMPGITAMAQNETGTVGAQVMGTLFMGTNDKGFSPGDRLEMNAWASYRANRYFAFSARATYQNWGRIDGSDPDLDPLRDPGNDGFGLGGSRLDFPLGITVLMPEGGTLAGHRLSVEYVFPANHKYDGPQLAADWGLVASWQVVF